MPQAAEKPYASHTLNHCRNVVMRVGCVRLLLILMLLTLGLWIVFANLVVYQSLRVLTAVKVGRSLMA